MTHPFRLRAAAVAGLLALLGCAPSRGDAQSTPAPAPAAAPVSEPESGRQHLLNTTALAGQPVAVVPVGLVAAGPELAADSVLWRGWADRRTAPRRADSLVADVLQERAAEVRWILPPRLRRASRQAPGLVPDPDHMGQAVLRAPRLRQVPGGLLVQLRNLLAVTDTRIVLVPAAASFGLADTSAAATSPVAVTAVLVLADVRTGSILWRTEARGRGATPDAALAAAVATVFPPEATTP